MKCTAIISALLLWFLALCCVNCQIPGPPGILRRLTLVEKRKEGFRTLKSALRDVWLPTHSAHPYLKLLDKEDKPSFREALKAKLGAGQSGLSSQLREIVDELSASALTISCPWDATLLDDAHTLLQTKFLLAANFKDNAPIMPQVIREIWMLASIVPSHNLFVSIYESGSEDSTTGEWLEVLSRGLSLLNVHHHIVAEGAMQRGNQERIPFLAQVRNKPLEPLWAAVDSHRRTATPWPAERVVYMNDVHVCAGDFLRLMLNPADMACGLDFWMRGKDQEYFNHERRETIHSFPGRRLMAQLYDAWVMRDGDGHMFDLKPPFDGMHSSYTRDRLRKGLPFPVTTCWNGMVVLPAKPFRDGLRIRTHMEGECFASECSLLCHDLHRLGYGRIVVDPGVQLTYEHWDAAGMHIPEVVGIERTTWRDVSQGQAIDESKFKQEMEECCNFDELDWSNLKCHMQSFMKPNYTATFLKKGQTVLPQDI